MTNKKKTSYLSGDNDIVFETHICDPGDYFQCKWLLLETDVKILNTQPERCIQDSNFCTNVEKIGFVLMAGGMY